MARGHQQRAKQGKLREAVTHFERAIELDSGLADAHYNLAETLAMNSNLEGAKKHWLAYTSRTQGELVVDDGAASALLDRGRSLLPAGIVEVHDRFGVGDPVSCVTTAGIELARGLTAYASDEVERIKGLGTGKIAAVLGYSNGNEVIHRDDLVVLDRQDRG